MPIVVRKGANTSYHGSGQLIEATRATIAAMRSTTAECRHLVEVSRSTIADTRTSIREVNALLQAAMFQFELISINQASPDRCRDAHAVVLSAADGDRFIRDPDGSVFHDLEAARSEAIESARELMAAGIVEEGQIG